MKKITRKSVLELTDKEARKFFLKKTSYCNIELPTYFDFSKLLVELDMFLSKRHYNQVKFPRKAEDPAKVWPKDLEDTNYKVFANKDGKYAWRPFEIINPVIYVALVHKITDSDNWKKIVKRFKHFQTDSRFECVSLPVKSYTKKSDKAALILHWWEVMEQKSIELALDYSILYEIDISGCYESIYTHSIPWAIHDKEIAKKRDKKLSGLGDSIDELIRDMRFGQTNGIPQGSVLMDFIAEMVLGYADVLIREKLPSDLDFRILRFRDDYKIFVHNSQDAELLLKTITEVLSSLGLKLNSAKTMISDCIISGSIKQDKIAWLNEKPENVNLEQGLFLIHQFSKRYPNTGSVSKGLETFNERLKGVKSFKYHTLSVISILADIAIKNPKYLPVCSAILSRLLVFIEDETQKNSVIDRIENRFCKSPNTGLLDIWLQRVVIPFKRKREFDEGLCKKVNDPQSKLWNFDWIAEPKLHKILDDTPFIVEEVIAELPSVIEDTEFSLFTDVYDSLFEIELCWIKRKSKLQRRLSKQKSLLPRARSKTALSKRIRKNNKVNKLKKNGSAINKRIKTNHKNTQILIGY